MTIWPNFEVNGLDWQCCLAGSSKTAPRILIFSIAMGADNSFYVKSIATYTPTFIGYIITVLARVCCQAQKNLPRKVFCITFLRFLVREQQHKIGFQEFFIQPVRVKGSPGSVHKWWNAKSGLMPCKFRNLRLIERHYSHQDLKKVGKGICVEWDFKGKNQFGIWPFR